MSGPWIEIGQSFRGDAFPNMTVAMHFMMRMFCIYVTVSHHDCILAFKVNCCWIHFLFFYPSSFLSNIKKWEAAIKNFHSSL
jgi:hypothetical protein